MKYSGARILIEALIEQGVDTVFGYPGAAVLFIYDELYRRRDRIRHVLVSHEQHAAHAADGYARATGKPGVCIATSGPGATNLVTGIAAAMMDSSPLVAITGNVSTSLLGKDSFQEVDIAGVTMPIVKHNWIVKDVNELAEVVHTAFIVAKSGRPGPVLIDIPKDITAEQGGQDVLGTQFQRLAAKGKQWLWSTADVEQAAALITRAKRPAIYAGGGVVIADASEEIVRFAEHINAPVALSLMGIGAFPREHPLCTGLLGMHGTIASNKVIQTTDLLIAVGARFSDRVTSDIGTFAGKANVLHFDIDPAEINKNIPTCGHVVGDIKETLAATQARLTKITRNGWGGDIEAWKNEKPASRCCNRKTLHPCFIIEETEAYLEKRAKTGKITGMAKEDLRNVIAVTDVGQHQMWTAQFFKADAPRSFITSGGLGAMGFGLGAAVGAKIARPDKQVVLFTGDGSFRMNCGEMATLSAYNLPILIVVFNNHVLGMVRQWQTLFHEGRYSETTLERAPDFVKLADAYGVAGFRAQSEDEFLFALDQAGQELCKGKAALIEVVIDPDEKVLPMVPGGKPIHEQLL
ncbi:MAG: biosynthetic-type acetolactate synthase large subunit [Treponema sp.]|jgi:acetolactate synthase-1/2/3 large subunit|nr:biosynthetic-type acetolactate synthase large subunit [Treponema sp.]